MAEKTDFGFWTLTFLVIANMIGAGVFTTSGFTLEELGSPGWVVAAWVVGGLIALAGAISYGRLIRAMPESGGEYLFLARAAHPLLGFIAGWVSLIAGFTGAIAYAATAFETYALPETLRPSWLPVDTVAVSAILLFGVFHGFRPRVGTFFQNIFVVLKLTLLVSFLVLAASTLPSGSWAGEPVSAQIPATLWSGLVAFAGSLVWISLSYSGFNAAVYLAEEAHEVKRTVPKALLVGTFWVMVVYVLLNAVFVYAPPPETILGKADVATLAAAWVGGDRTVEVVRVVISLALLTSVSSMMMAAPRVYAKMADDGFLPGFLAFTGEAPRGAIAMQAAFAAILVLVSSLRDLLSYLGLTLSLCAAMSVGCLFLPSIRHKPIFHLSHLPPLVYIACTLLAALLMTLGDPYQLLATAVTFSIGAVVYWVWARHRSHLSER